MKFNAFDLITPAIEDTKKLLFPFEMKKWLKLGFVSLLASNNSGGNGNGSGSSEDAQLFEKAYDQSWSSIRDSMGFWYYLLLPGFLLLTVISLIMAYISSVFSFIFLESLRTGKVTIRKSWHKNKGLGFSLFGIRVIMGLIVLVSSIVLLMPFIVPLFESSGPADYFQSLGWQSLTWFIPIAVVLAIILLIVGIFNFVLYNFAIVHMYLNKAPAWKSFKEVWAQVKKNIGEVLLFWVARIVVGLAIAIAAMLIGLILIIPVAIIFGVIIALGATVAYVAGTNMVIIVLGSIIGIALMLLLIYALAVILLPFSTFSWYFSIRNYKALMAKGKAA